jgi:Cu-Zn family superoxide dismutase
MHFLRKSLLACSGLLVCLAASGAEWTVPMHMAETTGPGASIGSVKFEDSAYGLVLTPSLSGLPPGVHGFHVHENGSCAPGTRDGAAVPALGAGGHLDPLRTGHHGLPWGDGHLGDLPALVVAADGSASMAVLAPRLKQSDVAGKALMVHAGGDNHADHPMALGGGGARIACGLISR